MLVQTIIVMGPTGSGKSAFINALIPPKSSSYIQVGHRFESETDEVRHIEWVNDDGLRIKLVDTPGFNDAREGPTDTNVLNMIASFLEKEYKAQTSKLVGLIYMHRVGDTRVGGTLDRNLRMFYKLCGQDSLKNVVIVVTTRNEVTPEEWRREQEILSSDNLFKPLVDGGAIVRRHDGAQGSASEIVDCLLGKNHVTTQIVRELVYERKTLEETSAGVQLRSELRASLQKHRRELEILEGELKSATTPLAKKELIEQKSTVKQSISSLNQQLNGLEGHSGTCEISAVDGLPSSAPTGRNLLGPDLLNRSSGSDGCSLPYAMVVPRDRFCHPDDVEPVFIGQPEWGRFQSSSMNTLPFTETECITNCTELLHSVNCVPDVFLMTPIRDDIMNQTVTWTRNFASHIEKNLGIAQSGYVALKNILRSRNPHELQNFANKFVNSVTSTLDQWRNSHTTMEKMYLEYHTSLRTKPGRLCWWLKRGKVEKRLCAMLVIVGRMKLLLGDITFAIDWWTSICNVVKKWEDAACLLASGRSFNDGIESELVYPIHILDSYYVGLQSLPERLRRIADSTAQDRHRVGDL